MMRLAAAAALSLGGSLAISTLAKVTIMTALALAVARVARHERAARRHLVFAVAFGVVLVLPVAAALTPTLPITIRVDSRGPALDTSRQVENADGAFAVFMTPPVVTRRESVTERAWRWVLSPSAPAGVWLLGVLVSLVPVASGMWQIRRLRRYGLPCREAQIITDAVARDIGLDRRVEVLRLATVDGPLTCGVLRPTILVPLDAQTWSHVDLARAITHELEHVRRHDWLTTCLARVACACYWFHPLVWIAHRQLRLDAERACDDAVLQHNEALGYADQLLTLAERLSARAPRPLLAMARRGDLSARVRAILDPTQIRGHEGASSLVAGIVAAIGLVVGLAPWRTAVTAQAPTAHDDAQSPSPTFDVVSVKRNRSGRDGGRTQMYPGGRFSADNATVQQLVLRAYGVQTVQIIGGPAWMTSDRFDVVAKVDRKVTPEGFSLMVRSLLRERFRLVAHTETRDRPIYALVLADKAGTLGPRMRRSTVDCDQVAADADKKGGEPPLLAPDGHLPCSIAFGAFGQMFARGKALPQLVTVFSQVTQRTVVDRTGLRGSFDVDLTWTPELSAPLEADATANGANGVSIFTALQEQLGLKLEAQKTSVSVLVIDRIEPPTEN